MRTINAYFIIFCLLLAAGLPKNHYFREKDKLVFREIGTYVAARERHNPGFTSILASGTIRQLAFYANRDKPELILPYLTNLDAVTGSTCEDFFGYLRTSKTRYFLWEEKFWLGQAYSLEEHTCRGRLEELKRWHHPDTGQMVLYKVNL